MCAWPSWITRKFNHTKEMLLNSMHILQKQRKHCFSCACVCMYAKGPISKNKYRLAQHSKAVQKKKNKWLLTANKAHARMSKFSVRTSKIGSSLQGYSTRISTLRPHASHLVNSLSSKRSLALFYFNSVTVHTLYILHSIRHISDSCEIEGLTYFPFGFFE